MQIHILKKLKFLGLTEKEGLVYVKLLSIGEPITAYALSRLLNVSPPGAYMILERLEKKGFVFSDHSRPKRYIAAPPEVAIANYINLLETKLTSMKKIAQELSTIVGKESSKSSENDAFWLISGQKAVMEHVRGLINKAQREILAYVSPEGLIRMVKLHDSEYFAAMKRGVKINVLAPITGVPFEIIKRIKEWGELKAIDEIYARFLVIDCDEAVVMTHTRRGLKHYVGLWTRNPHFIMMLRIFFKVIEEKSKEIVI